MPRSSPLLACLLRCEGRDNPLGIDAERPRLSWNIASAERGARVSSWEVAVASSRALLATPDIWQSGRVQGDAVLDVHCGGALAPRTRYFWRVRVWNAARIPGPWSNAAWFEMALRDSPWQAEWIGGPEDKQNDAPAAVYVRRSFELPVAVRRARLYLSALGTAEPWLNGRRVAQDFFIPGWTDYARRVPYLTYDVTRGLRVGENTLGVILGNGWYSGIFGPAGFARRQASRPLLLARLEVELRDGTTIVVTTDSQWRWGEGAVRENSIYHGETYDARAEIPNWAEPSGDPGAWRAVVIGKPPAIAIEAKKSPPVRRIAVRAARKLSEPKPGIFVFDFGQNFSGWARLRLRAPAGTRVQLRFAEMLQPDGMLYTENLRAAKATDVYHCKGDAGGEEWEPRFTFHGFRYVELTGWPKDRKPTRAAVAGIVVHSDIAETGEFSCSHPLVNRLQRCIRWSQRGNFLEIPTDCPQRDERLGWAGDAQVFASTACFNYDSGEFFRQWMDAMRDGQTPDGAFPDTAPDWLNWRGNAGWGDAGVIVPWTVWRTTGRTRILEENYAAMAAWIDFQKRTSRDFIRPETVYGDWLAIDAVQPVFGPTPKDLIGTAYFAFTARLMSEMGKALGKTKDEAAYASLAKKVAGAFQRRFVTPDGLVLGDTQTAYLLALGFDLVPTNLRPAAIARLVHRISTRENHLTTGFLGTPLLNPVLSACGRTDIAYALLLQKTYPGWLYPVLNGATTMWERWNSWTREKGFGPVEMNSFNHYAYGAVGAWLYETVGGLAQAHESAGWSRVRIAPQPGGGLTHARVSFLAPRGTIDVAWRLAGKRYSLQVALPIGVGGVVHFPCADAGAVTESGRSLRGRRDMKVVSRDGEAVRVEIAAGAYRFLATGVSEKPSTSLLH